MFKINRVLFTVCFAICYRCFVVTAQSLNEAEDSLMFKRIFDETLTNGKAYKWLYDLSTNIGGRLGGSPQAAQAVEWAKKTMIEAGADSVWLQPCNVVHWVRGEKEVGTIIQSNGKKQDVPTSALGMSVATPKQGITAEVVEVYDFDELQKLGEKRIKGKIVFYNHPFDQRFINTFQAYGETGKYRYSGPSEAARYGAVATILRSLSSSDNDYPHTGSMGYNDSLPKVPCAAISTNAANLLSMILKADPKTKFYLKQNCELLDSVQSYSVVGMIRGTEHPDEIVVVGGHLDSWDTGKGAHDDGAGVVQSIEVLRIYKALGLRPKRTIRAVAFMNEENGLMGGKKYAELAELNKEKHVAAVESDAGGFLPMGFGLGMPEDKKAVIRKWAPLFLPYNIFDFQHEGDGADISPMRKMNIPLIGMHVDTQRYFEIHHAFTDNITNVNRRELLLGAGALASMVYLLQEYGL